MDSNSWPVVQRACSDPDEVMSVTEELWEEAQAHRENREAGVDR